MLSSYGTTPVRGWLPRNSSRMSWIKPTMSSFIEIYNSMSSMDSLSPKFIELYHLSKQQVSSRGVSTVQFFISCRPVLNCRMTYCVNYRNFQMLLAKLFHSIVSVTLVICISVLLACSVVRIALWWTIFHEMFRLCLGFSIIFQTGKIPMFLSAKYMK